jgi:hypothetical protein
MKITELSGFFADRALGDDFFDALIIHNWLSAKF